MKNLIVILMFVSTNALTQSFERINYGLDTIALSNQIKSKFEITIEIDSFQMDTLWKVRYDYLPNGYLKRYEEIDLKNIDTTNSWLWNLCYHFIEFTYNEAGYLIDKKVQWDGPVNVASEPDSMQITTKKTFNNKHLIKETTIQTTWYSSDDNFTDTTITTYNLDGSIAMIERPQFSYKINYRYNEKGLLLKVEYSNAVRLFKYKEIKYEYF